MTVNWTTPSNNGSPIQGYVVTPYISGNPQSERVFYDTATSQTITGLTNGTAYTFRVAAFNAVGTGSQCRSVGLGDTSHPARRSHLGRCCRSWRW